ncbi:MAG: V-type ATP synthase subunit D [Gammaproteobacteria bacterium]
MASLSLNKSALHRESEKLKRYAQYLPSLDLKRRKLIADRYQASVKLEHTQKAIRQCRSFIVENLSMISDPGVDLSGLVQVSTIKVGVEHVMGNPMPVLEHLTIDINPYSLLGQPHWVDQAVVQLKLMLELQIQLRIEQKRMVVLEGAVKKVTRRVNLFEKVLIPRTEMNIKKIRIFLSDSERAAVVRAKKTKQKHSRESRLWPS